MEGHAIDIQPTDALIVVDLQNDFCPGGALPVTDGHQVARAVNKFLRRFDRVVFTRDWHPDDHCSFSDEPEFVDGSWPVHCVQHSPGAAFVGDISVPLNAIVVDKGCDEDAEQYSAFDDSDLAATLRAKGITRVYVCGLATDYCVKHTALGGRENGFEVVLIRDACRAVDNPPGSKEQALEDMKDAGVAFCQTRDLAE